MKPPSSGARPGVPRGSRGTPLAPHHTQLPRFSPGIGGAAGRLKRGRGIPGRGRPPARVACRGGGGDVPLAPSCSPRMAPPAE